MAATAKERAEFTAILERELQETYRPAEVARVAVSLLRSAATLQRLAEAECNGDYPCDNGDRPVVFCSRCEAGYVRSHCRGGICDSCRVAERVDRLAKGYGLEAVHGGDPRGAVLKLIVPSGYTNDWGQSGVCVPA